MTLVASALAGGDCIDDADVLRTGRTARFGLGEQLVTTKTLRRRFFSLAGQLTGSTCRLILHLPERWRWENQLSGALARLRALPLAC